MDEPKYDVVIYHIETRKVGSIAGRDLPMSRGEGSYSASAEKRIDTVLGRLNDSYSACAVDAGKFKEGDVLCDDDMKA